MKLTPDILKNLIKSAQMASEHEIGCEECFEELHEFAELELAGKSAAEAKPLVQDHLNKCGSCREEYQALLEALRTIENSQ
jgi:predicted anti-sigma-YlaC factor YlaD